MKIDWSDFDGNGTDDLALFVDDSNNLDLGIFYTNAADHNMPTFTNMKNFYIENYLHGLNIINLRTFDANGDGLADISIPHTFDSNSFSLSFLINTNNSEFRFNKDIQFTRPKNIDFFIKAEKYEFADENNDGIEDFIQITEIDNKPAKIVYFLESI